MKSVREYLKIGFVNPREVIKARKMSRKQMLGYFALLALLITLSMTAVLTSVMTNLRDDGQEIAENIPAFEIENSEFVTDNQESYIHQTNTFLFFFDPNGEISLEEVESNVERLSVPVGVALLEDGFYLNVTGRTLPLPYDQLEGFNQESLVRLFQQLGTFSPLVLLFTFIVGFIASSFSLAYEWLIVALFANIIATLQRIRSPFRKNARVALVSLSIPTLVISVIEAFGYFVPLAFELKLAFSIYFIYTSFKSLRPKTKDK